MIIPTMKTSHYINSLLYLLASLLLGILISTYIPLQLHATITEKPERIKKVEAQQTPTWGASSWAKAR